MLARQREQTRDRRHQARANETTDQREQRLATQTDRARESQQQV